MDAIDLLSELGQVEPTSQVVLDVPCASSPRPPVKAGRQTAWHRPTSSCWTRPCANSRCQLDGYGLVTADPGC